MSDRRVSTRRRTFRLKRPMRCLLRYAPRCWCRREVTLPAPLPYQGSVPLAELRQHGAARRTCAGLSAVQERSRAVSSCAAMKIGVIDRFRSGTHWFTASDAEATTPRSPLERPARIARASTAVGERRLSARPRSRWSSARVTIPAPRPYEGRALPAELADSAGSPGRFRNVGLRFVRAPLCL